MKSNYVFVTKNVTSNEKPNKICSFTANAHLDRENEKPNTL